MKLIIKISFLTVLSLTVLIGSCKKQDKCGCDGDIIHEMVGTPAYVYYDTVIVSASFTPLNNQMATYNFCNPTEMLSKLKRHDSGSILLIDGHAYWDCNYMYQASNNSYSYQSYQYSYQVYMITVTDVYENLYE